MSTHAISVVVPVRLLRFGLLSLAPHSPSTTAYQVRLAFPHLVVRLPLGWGSTVGALTSVYSAYILGYIF